MKGNPEMLPGRRELLLLLLLLFLVESFELAFEGEGEQEAGNGRVKCGLS